MNKTHNKIILHKRNDGAVFMDRYRDDRCVTNDLHVGDNNLFVLTKKFRDKFGYRVVALATTSHIELECWR